MQDEGQACKRMYITVAAVWKYIHVENEEII